MSNVISLCDYRERKMEERIEAEWDAWDKQWFARAAEQEWSVVTDEELKALIDFLSDSLEDDFKPNMWVSDQDTTTYTITLKDEQDNIILSWGNGDDEPKS